MLTIEVDLQEANKNKIVNVAGSYEIDRLADRRPEFYSIVTAEASRSHGADLGIEVAEVFDVRA